MRKPTPALTTSAAAAQPAAQSAAPAASSPAAATADPASATEPAPSDFPRPVATAITSAPAGSAAPPRSFAPISFYQHPNFLPPPMGHWAAPKTPDDPEPAVARLLELGGVPPDLQRGPITDWLAQADLGVQLSRDDLRPAARPAASQAQPLINGPSTTPRQANSLAKPGDDALSDPEIIREAALRAMKLVFPDKDFESNFKVLNEDLVQVTDPEALDLAKWAGSVSTHTTGNAARELEIPGHSGFVVKYYADDKHGHSVAVTVGPTLGNFLLQHVELWLEDHLPNHHVNPMIARWFLGEGSEFDLSHTQAKPELNFRKPGWAILP